LKPKIFYENILRYISDFNPEEGHFLERSWYLIFNNNFYKKDIIEYKLFHNPLSIFYEDFNLKDNIYTNKSNKSNQIHLWIPISANYDIGINSKIHFMKSINKYITLNTKVINNSFNIGIKSSNDVSIIINSEYEIILGIFDNSKSIIRDIINNKILGSYEYKTLDKDKLLNFNFSIKKNNIIIKKENQIIFNNDIEIDNIKSVKIKNNGNYNIELSYEHINDLYNNNNIKIYLINNHYEDIDYFYRNNYLDYYIKKIDE
jgi:hypothetical protein